MLLRYLNETEKYTVDFLMFNQNVIQVKGDFPIKTGGFELSRHPKDVYGLDEESSKDFWDGWDHSAFTTVYREIDNGVQFSNDGSIYIEPEQTHEPPDTEPYVPTLEEVQEMKVSEMNAMQQMAIQQGVDVTLTDV